jgi:pyruvate,orthophosphate dikinase
MCKTYDETKEIPNHVWESILFNIQRLQQDMGRAFGDETFPLLLSCRSGAKISMPGMLDTVLNIGLNSNNVQGLARVTSNPRFAYDSYRRLLDMFGDVGE